MSSFRCVIYIGVTGDLERRVQEHRARIEEGFTRKYRCNQLVYFEEFATPEEAISREKQIKAYRREKKIQLIERMNPEWHDLSIRLFE
jgi:putative endonuclease